MSVQVYTDMTGRQVMLQSPPKRIISLVPSQTELLFDLGLEDEIVGITKFCVHPESWYRNKKRVGGTKNVNIDVVKALQPDLIIANKEENTKEQVEALAALYPVWISDIRNIEEALQMISMVGILIDRSGQAQHLQQEIKNGFASFAQPPVCKRVAYFIWRNPWMCAGGDTFISSMIEKMGWENVLKDKMRYPEIQLGSLSGMNIDKVMLSSEPYPFKETHIAEIKAILPGIDVQLVDGEMFSWYGSRLNKALPYLQSLININ